MAASILLQLSLLTLVTNSCLAMLTSMTIIQGSTLTLNCPLGDARNVEWKNPRGEVMDKRNSIETLSSRLFEISVTDVTFKDGGNYTCSQYGHGDVVEKVVAVTVLANKISQTTWTPSPVDEPQGSTDSLRRTTIGRTDQSTKDTLMATYSTEASPEATSLEATAGNTASSTGIRRDSMSVAYAPANEFTEMNITQETSHNSTKGNGTRSNLEERENQRGHQKHASWLIFLVTCLIVALSVVVLFLAIKLRRAHIHWKRENEDSDQSSESHKTKSSDEEKRWPGQKCRGIFNIVFTKYAVEEPTGVSNITAPVVVPTETYIQHVEPSQSHVQPHANVPAPVKETAL
ncbi:hypothetical protein NHX12_009947 [Muraenolepis orangiensis]|uniref:Immunoglobulin domain-containing protein n=1 Tax=Muraenolepis orangiensis TaxID=630683 RepID=A0A9Q0DHB5_9TELE|nr:hypothetical protein NHX12_009947 [Muraenolepis orangiensis]